MGMDHLFSECKSDMRILGKFTKDQFENVTKIFKTFPINDS